MRQLTLEAQREFMMRRGGFSQNHPFISGEVPVHPELQGRLPFNVSPARYGYFIFRHIFYAVTSFTISEPFPCVLKIIVASTLSSG